MDEKTTSGVWAEGRIKRARRPVQKDRIGAMTVEQLRAHILDQIVTYNGTGTNTVSYASGGKRYTFYWFGLGRSLAVSVRRVAVRSRANVEALAASLAKTRTCPVCHESFPRNGKQRFCSPAHAATGRKRRWTVRERQRAKEREIAEAKATDARKADAAWSRRVGQRLRDPATRTTPPPPTRPGRGLTASEESAW